MADAVLVITVSSRTLTIVVFISTLPSPEADEKRDVSKELSLLMECATAASYNLALGAVVRILRGLVRHFVC